MPVAETLAAQVISLPVFPELTPAEQSTVINTIGEVLNRSKGDAVLSLP
jgi:dTDP-4-amino-4,6-dideoxygalactose transaminase